MIPPKHPSVSNATEFSEICERRSFLDRLMPRQETPAMQRGKAVHEGIESLMLQAQDVEPDTLKDWLELWDEHALCAWGHPNARYLPIADPYVRRLCEWRGLELLRPVEDGVERWFSEIPGWEEMEGAALEILGPIRWNGKIDLLAHDDGALTVLDWKTISRVDKAKSVREAKRSLQLQVYCLVTGARRAGFVWLPPTGEVFSTIVEFTELELDRARIWAYNHSCVIRARWGQLADDCANWEEVFAMAAPGHPLCCRKWCDYWNVCFDRENADMGTLKEALQNVGDYFTNPEFEKIGTATFTIRDLKTVTMGGRGDEGKEDKPVLFFVETRKGLVLNKTRITQLGEIFEDADKEYKDCGDKVKLVFDPKVKINGRNFEMICLEQAD